jgi:hypothetical protein
MLRRVAFVKTDYSKERIASIFTAERISELMVLRNALQLLFAVNVVPSLLIRSNL